MLHKESKTIIFFLKDQQIPRKHRETTEQIKEINTGSGYEIHFKKWFWKHNKNIGDKKLWTVNGWSLTWLKDQRSIYWCRRCWCEAWRHRKPIWWNNSRKCPTLQEDMYFQVQGHSDSHSHFIVKMQRTHKKRKLKTVEKNTTSLIKENPSDQQISQQNAKAKNSQNEVFQALRENTAAIASNVTIQKHRRNKPRNSWPLNQPCIRQRYLMHRKEK